MTVGIALLGRQPLWALGGGASRHMTSPGRPGYHCWLIRGLAVDAAIVAFAGDSRTGGQPPLLGV